MFPVIAILTIILFPVLIPLAVSASHHVGDLRKRISFQTMVGRQRPARRLA
jgi:hypothetical protein